MLKDEMGGLKMKSDLGKDSIIKLVLKLAIPSMIAQLVNVLYSIIDRMFIGQIPLIGDLALAGVGVCGPIVTLLSSFGTLVGIGGSILMSMKMGEKKNDEAETILSNSFIMLIGISLGLTILFLFSKEYLITWFGGSSDIFEYANTYLTIYTLGTFFALLAMGLNYFITCQGFSMIAMFTVLMGAITNIVLDALFINVLNLGVAGAAWATVIAQVLSCFFAFGFLISKKTHIAIKLKKFSWDIAKKIIHIGFSPFIIIATDSIIIIVMNTVLQKYGGPLQGDILISSATIVQSYFLLITGPLIGITGGTQAIISYNYGARNAARVKKAIYYILGLSVLFCSVMFIVSRAFPLSFISLFTRNEEVIRLSIWGIQIFTLAIIPMAFQYEIVDALTALGNINVALCLSMFRKCLYMICTIVIPIYFAIEYVFYAQTIADVCAAILSTTVYLKTINTYLQNREMNI